MPKKSATARGGAQRGKARAQKSFELVRPVLATHEQEPELETQDVAEMAAASTNTSNTSKASSIATVPAAKKVVPEVSEVSEVSEEPVGEAVTSASAAPKATGSGSASSRLAARRQATQQRTQRSASPLVTAEHYAYVRKDLMFIAILAIIMFAAIIILHFTLG